MRLSLETPDAKPEPLIRTNRVEERPDYSPSGQRTTQRIDDGSIEHLDVDGVPGDWWGDGEKDYLIYRPSREHPTMYGEALAGAQFQFKEFAAKGFWGSLSHDGRFIVYLAGVESDDRRFEVRSFPEGNGPWQVSLAGELGSWLKASPAKNEIFYSTGGYLMSVEYSPGPPFAVTTRTRLFQIEDRYFDVAPDGESFYILEPFEGDERLLRVTQNWWADLADGSWWLGLSMCVGTGKAESPSASHRLSSLTLRSLVLIQAGKRALHRLAGSETWCLRATEPTTSHRRCRQRLGIR